MFLFDVSKERRVAEIVLSARANEGPILAFLLGTVHHRN